MRKKAKRAAAVIIAVLVTFSIFCTGRTVSYASGEGGAEGALADTIAFMQSQLSSPGYGSEWYIFDAARYGIDPTDPYFSGFYNSVANTLSEKNGILSNSSDYTKYSKEILALTSIGYDARNVAGYNLFDKISDTANLDKQGINSYIYALIAYSCHSSYTQGNEAYIGTLISYLVGEEKANGGWALIGDYADTDITGMTIQALAPYYNVSGHEDVTAAIDRAVAALSSKQLEDGGFGTMESENAESCAQAITALCAVNIDPGSDSRFIKNGFSALDNLLSFYIPGNGFMHMKGGAYNGLATVQSCYALVSYHRMLAGQRSLYDMSEIALLTGGNGDAQAPNDTGEAGGNSGGEAGADTESGGAGSGAAEGSENQTDTNDPSSGSQPASGSATVGRTVGTTAEEADNAQDGWSFTGETYTPEDIFSTAAVSQRDAGQEDAVKEGNGVEQAPVKQAGLPFWAFIVLCSAGGGFAGYLIYNKRKKANVL